MEFHVLLVEDDRVTLKTVEQLLRKCNYRVSCAANGREAIKVLTTCRQNGVKVDLILTDILMPEVTGFDLINEVVHGEAFCDVPVVVMSSQDSQESVLQAFQAGAADYLIKPIRKNELATLWQHVWRANKAKGSGSGATVTAGGHHLCGRDEPEGAAAAGEKAGPARQEHLKDSSGGSSGAATSMLRSTGGTLLPARAATIRQPAAAAQPPGPSEQSGELTALDLPGLQYQQFRQQPRAGDSAAAAAGTAAQCSSAAGPALGGGRGRGGVASASIPHVPSGPLPFGPLCTSVAVHFDLNPVPGAARRPAQAFTDHRGAANGAAGRGVTSAAAAATSECAAGTSATVISWSHADPTEAEPVYDPDVEGDAGAAAAAAADDDAETDGVGDGAEDPPRKRPRLLEGRSHHARTGTANKLCNIVGAVPGGPRLLPAGRAAAEGSGGGGGGSTAAACRLAAAEGSQGSRAASASAGPDGGARESTATRSGDTFAESPSAYTVTATTTSTTNTTGSGSETEEQQHHQQPHSDIPGAGHEGSPAIEQGPHSGFRRYGSGANDTAAGPGPGPAAAAHGHAAGMRRTATSAGPELSAAFASSAPACELHGGAGPGAGPGLGSGPPPTAASAAAGADAAGGLDVSSIPHAQHSLPHPAAAALGAASPGGAVTLPPGLRELAALGAARHQELWTQRALMHQQHQQHQQQQRQHLEAAARSAGAGSCSAVTQLARGFSGASATGAAAGTGTGGGTASRSGLGAAAVGSTMEPSGAARNSGTVAAAVPLGPGAQQEVAVAASALALGQKRRETSAAGSGAGGSTKHGNKITHPSCGAAAADGDSGSDAAAAVGSSQPSNSLSLLRHSDRSAFTAFTVFLPGRVAAGAATAARPQAPPQAPIFNHPAATAATAAAAAASCGSVLYRSHHHYGQPNPHGAAQAAAVLPPPAAVQILSPMMPLHLGAAAARPPHQLHGAAAPKPPDSGAAASGSNGALGPAAAAAAAAMAAAAAHMPYAGMQHASVGMPARALAFGSQTPPSVAAAAAGAAIAPPPVCIPESVLQLIAHLSGRAAAELPVPETVTAAPVVVQKAPSAARLAAVAKYLEKRKHRNFQKKVRYESRKRLAEARPRVRGQFVKASVAPAAAAGTDAAVAAAGAAHVLTALPLRPAAASELDPSVAAAGAGGPSPFASVATAAAGTHSRAAAAAAATGPLGAAMEGGVELPDQDADMEDDGGEAEDESDESVAEA